MPKKAIIIGAGIGGLSTAIAIQKKGWNVSVFDRTSSLTEAGAGIVLAANAMKALVKLGVAKDVVSIGAAVGKAEIRTWNGELILDLPTSRQAKRYGSQSFLIHRGKLQSILLEKVEEASIVKLNKQLASVEQNNDKVIATFTDGSKEEGDILIGADGLHSIVREQLFGTLQTRYSGYTALRGICSFKDERYTMEQGGGFEAWGPGKRFGFSQLGQGQVFWFAAINAPRGETISSNDRKQVALNHFNRWFEPIQTVIAATVDGDILHHDIVDYEPLPYWSKGRITLLGDAAHPMLPNLGQGGAQAMEDALVLARCLAEPHINVNLPSSLQEYEKIRKQRTTKIVQQSRRMGRMVQLENQLAITVRNSLLRHVPNKILIERLNWIVGHKV